MKGKDMDTLEIISPQTLFKNRVKDISRLTEKLSEMKTINEVTFKIYSYLQEKRAEVKGVEDKFDTAETIRLFDYWIDESNVNNMIYVDNADLLKYLRQLQEENPNILIGYIFNDTVKVKFTNRNLAMDLGFASDYKEVPFNYIGSIVVASKNHKKMWFHVTWKLSLQHLKKMGWKPFELNKAKALKKGKKL